MIYIGADHAGYELKNNLILFLKEKGLEVEDCGAFKFEELDDYPDFIIETAEKVSLDLNKNLGIVIGGSWQGEAIVANKVKGIRAALYYGGPKEIITLSKIHNNANVLSLGARFVNLEEAKEVVDLWINEKFKEEDRHKRRVEKILKYEYNK